MKTRYSLPARTSMNRTIKTGLLVVVYLFTLGWVYPTARAEATITAPCTADTYIHSGFATSNWNSSSPLTAYYPSSSSVFKYKIYMRFDLSSVPAARLSSARLVVNNVSGACASVSVYGLNDGDVGENWGETTITWNNAPGNDTTSGNGLLSGSVTSLGSFTPSSGTVTFSSPALRDFISADTNDKATFILVANTYNAYFYCNNREAGLSPQLVVTLAPPDISDLNATPTLAQAGDTVQIGFRSSDPLAGQPTVIIGGHTATFYATDGLNYEYRYTVGETESGWANLNVTGQSTFGAPFSASLKQAVYYKNANSQTSTPVYSLPFDAATTICTGNGPNAPFGIEDIDCEGDKDLIYGTASSIMLRKNDGTGTFGSPITLYTTTTLGRSLIVTDIDKDADPDVAFIAGPMNMIAYLPNGGTGTYGTARTICSQTTGATTIIAADLNRDARTDIVYTAPGANTIGWCQNMGAGNFAAPVAISTAVTTPTAITTGDIDRDGDPDIVAATAGGQVVFLANAGSGSFGAAQVIGTVPAGTNLLSTADLDRDADADVIVTSTDAGTAIWLCNANGDGSVWYQEDIPAPAGTAAILPFNIDADGDLDLLCASSSQADLLWFENTDSSAMDWRQRTLRAGAGVNALAAADLDFDGDADVVAGTAGGGLIWYRNHSLHHKSTFQRQCPNVLADSNGGATAADIDGDGDHDMLIVGSYVYWYENTGNPNSWPAHQVCSAPYSFDCAASADLDRDGDQDIVAYTHMNIGVLWFENTDSKGTAWIQHTLSAAPYVGYSIACADIDRDGDPDVIVPDNYLYSTPHHVYWYENADGHAGAWTQHTVSSTCQPNWVSPVDMDLDGDLDLLAAHGSGSSGGQVNWYENTAGNGSAWTDRLISSGFRTVKTARPAHVNKNVSVDVVAADSYDPRIWVWENRHYGPGLPSFYEEPFGHPTRPYDVNCVDFDSDGDMDLFEADGNTNNILYWDRRGPADWGDYITIGGCDNAHTIEFADLNGDGNIDLVPGVGTTAGLSWCQNIAAHVSYAGYGYGGGNVQQGASCAALKIVASHLGRAGDSTIRLTSASFKITDVNGVALSQTQVSALIHDFSLVLDNGSGSYESVLDAVVLTTSSLTVDANGQFSLAARSSNSSLSVGYGSNQTFFIVLTLKADAAVQSPYQFKIHLVPEAMSAVNTLDGLPVRIRPAAITSSNPVTAIGPPDISLEPDHVDFGNRGVGGAFSAPIPVQVRNTGLGPLHVISITTSGAHTADFHVSLPQGAPTIERGTSVTLSVSFRPLGAGPRTSMIRISSDDPDEPNIDIPLTGYGLAPDIQVTPLSVDFSSRLLGQSPTTYTTVVISNIGNADLNVTQVALVGPDTSDFVLQNDTAQTVLPPGSNRLVGLNFVPTGAGLKTAALRVVSDDADTSTVNVSLSGSGLMLETIWLDFSWTQSELGLIDYPVNTLAKAIIAVQESGTIRIKGNTARNWSNEHPRITKPLRIEAIDGPVAIGSSGPAGLMPPVKSLTAQLE